jgi:hypothetical protein
MAIQPDHTLEAPFVDLLSWVFGNEHGYDQDKPVSFPFLMPQLFGPMYHFMLLHVGTFAREAVEFRYR